MLDNRLINKNFTFKTPDKYSPREYVKAICKDCKSLYDIRLDRLAYYKCNNVNCQSVYIPKTIKFKEDYKLVNNDKGNWDNWYYLGLRTGSHYNCSIHGIGLINPDQVKRGMYCKECSDIVPYTTETMRASLNKIYKDNKRLSFSKSICNGVKSKIDFHCSIHGKQTKLLDTLLTGVGCSKCNRLLGNIKMRETINNPKFKANKKNGNVLKYGNADIINLLPDDYKLVTNYRGGVNPIHIKCSKGHVYKTKANNITRGYGLCRKCNNIGTSKMEEELASFLSDYCVVERHIKPFKDNREIDIYLPEHNLFIEFDGVYWHSDKYKNSNYQKDKTFESLELGKKIIHITDSQWLHHNNIIKSILINKINLTPFNIGARKCYIKEVDIKEAKVFMDNNHLQGYVNSSVKIGLFYQEELLSLLTFSLDSIVDKRYNLNRFVTKTYTNVKGGFSKLLHYFKNNYDYNEIISFADLQWSQGDVYNQNNFQELYITKPSYNYYDKNLKMYHKSFFRKSKLIKLMREYNLDYKNKTEFEMADSLGLIRYWDSGKIKYLIN